VHDDISAESETDRFLFEAVSAAAGEHRDKDGARGELTLRIGPAEEEDEVEAAPSATAEEREPSAPAAESWQETPAAPPVDRFFDRDLFREERSRADVSSDLDVTDTPPAWPADERTSPAPRVPRYARHEDEYEPPRLDEADAVQPQSIVDDSAPRSRVALPALLLGIGLLAGVGIGYSLWGGAAATLEQTARPGIDATPSAASDASRSGTGAPAATSPAPGATTATSGPAAGGSGAAAPRSTEAVGTKPTSAAADAPAATPAVPAGRGTLVVRSTPTGAGVTVNGTWRGRTPLRLGDLPFARYDVRIVEPGYRVVSESLALSAGSPERTVTARLQRDAPAAGRAGAQGARGGAPGRGAQPAGSTPAAARGTQPGARGAQPPAQGFTGSIYVDSRPRGATVAINGKPVGVTPLRVPEIRIGTHVVRLELPDHRIWSSTARVTAGQEARVTGSLEPIQ